MDLWILSQNKDQLVKTNVVRCVTTSDIRKTKQIYIITNNEYDFGIYETRERALEVLGEIKRLLMGQNNMLIKTDCCDIALKDLKLIKESIEKNHWVGTTGNIEIEYISPTTIVYEMPEK